jgi:hypothetical protein
MAKRTLVENIQRVKESLLERFDAGKQAMRDDFFGSKTDWSYFNYYGANSDILNQLNYEDTKNGTSFKYMVAFSQLTTVPPFDTSNGTDFSYMFYSCSALTEIPELDTSNGTDFSNMFYNCSALTEIPELDTSNGTTFKYMFNGCKKIKSIPQIDTSSGVNGFDYMFNNCVELVTIPELDFSKGTNFYSTFYGCKKLVSLPKIKFGNGSLMTTFSGCTALKTIEEIDFTNGLNPSQTFKNCTSLQTMNVVGTINKNFDFSQCPLNIESLRTIKNALEDFSNKTLSWTPKLTIGSANIAKFSAEELEEITQKGWLYQ